MKILKNALFAAAAGTLLALPGAANATEGSTIPAAAPSILGPTGLLYTPDGRVTPSGCVALGYHHAKGDPYVVLRPAAGGGVRAVVIEPNVNAYKVNIGIGNHFEVGYTALNTGERTVRAPFPAGAPVSVTGGTMHLANAKLSLLPPSSPFSIAGGVIDGFDQIPQITGYGYIGVNIGEYLGGVPLMPKRFHFGGGYGFGIIDGWFANASLPIVPNLEIMFEWLDNDLLGVAGPGNQYNIGGRFRVGKALPGLALDIGATDFMDEPQWVAGISYTWCPGGRRHHKKDEGEDKGDEKGEPKEEPKDGMKPGQASRSPLGGSPVFRSSGLR